MDPSWLDDNTLAVLIAGVIAPAVGIVGILFGRNARGKSKANTILAGAGFLTLATALALAWGGWSPQVWLFPLAIAGLCGAFYAVGCPALKKTTHLIVLMVERPTFQFGALLILGPLAAIGWSSHADDPGTFEVPSYLINQPELLESSPYRTDRGRVVPLIGFNAAAEERAAWERGMASQGMANLPDEVFRVSEPDFASNCHGWVFTGGAAMLRGREVELILQDNGYDEVAEPQRGDLIVYRSESGYVIHSGIVHLVSVDGEVQIHSKWGCDGRYLHPPHFGYVGDATYYRTERGDHLLVKEAPASAVAGQEKKPSVAKKRSSYPVIASR